jgi:uncharacterized membrane protein
MINILPDLIKGNFFAYLDLIIYMIIYLLLLFIIIYIILFILAWIIIPRDKYIKEKALKTLEKRYKRKEIDKEEYETKRKDILK